MFVSWSGFRLGRHGVVVAVAVSKFSGQEYFALRLNHVHGKQNQETTKRKDGWIDG